AQAAAGQRVVQPQARVRSPPPQRGAAGVVATSDSRVAATAHAACAYGRGISLVRPALQDADRPPEVGEVAPAGAALEGVGQESGQVEKPEPGESPGVPR